jgi:hypothetical protein
MKRSNVVPATLVASIAALALAGCSERRDCVDSMGNILPDTACNTGSTYRGSSYPHWIYGGSRSSSGRITGGSSTPHHSSSLSRGGFGGGHSSGGFGG